MKSFEEIKSEIEYKIATKKERIVNLLNGKDLESHQVEFFDFAIMELDKMNQNMDLTTKKEIYNRIQHLKQMIKAGKSMKDIEKFTGLGLTKNDGEIFNLINKNTFDKSDATNKIIEEQLLNHYQISLDKLSNNEEIKRTM